MESVLHEATPGLAPSGSRTPEVGGSQQDRSEAGESMPAVGLVSSPRDPTDIYNIYKSCLNSLKT